MAILKGQQYNSFLPGKTIEEVKSLGTDWVLLLFTDGTSIKFHIIQDKVGATFIKPKKDI